LRDAESAALIGHTRVEARSLAMHRAIEQKLRARPELLAIAHDNLKRWMAEPGHSQPYLEGMTALRQSTPFAGVLSPRERWAIYDAFATGARDTGSGGHRQ
jgi:hypothetical protein